MRPVQLDGDHVLLWFHDKIAQISGGRADIAVDVIVVAVVVVAGRKLAQPTPRGDKFLH